MTNPYSGEVEIAINGVPQVCKLTLGALAALEAELQEGSLVSLVERFEAGRFRSQDVMAVIIAGLRGGGWTGQAADLMDADIAGGPIGAAQAAAVLLARAFAVPD